MIFIMHHFIQKIESFAYFVRGPNARINRYVLARFEQNQVREVIEAVNKKMESIYPGQPIVYSFLD